jgi:hypothetical protein
MKILLLFSICLYPLSWSKTYLNGYVLTTGVVLFLLLKREFNLWETIWSAHEKERTELLLKLELKNQELIKAYDATIEGWSMALELRG